MTRRRGSLSLFMVLVIPAIILGCVVTFRLLYDEQVENKRLKVIQYASETTLSTYNDFLLSQYGLTGYYSSDNPEALVTYYLERNGLALPETLETTHLPLSSPEHFAKASLASAKVLVPIAFVDEAKQRIENPKQPSAPTGDDVPTEAELEAAEEEGGVPEEVDQVEDMEARAEEMKEGGGKGGSDTRIDSRQWEESRGFLAEVSLLEKTLIKEYYLAVFSSYDPGTPHAFDPLGQKASSARLFKGEVEYLIAGENTDAANKREVWLKIYGMRELTNLAHLALSPDKMSQIGTWTAAIPPPWNLVAHAGIVVAWASAESYVDMNILADGGGLYPIKSSVDWTLDFDSLLTGNWRMDTQKGKGDSDALKWYYQDYLRALIYLTDTEKTVCRAMDLVDGSLQKQSQKALKIDDFAIGHRLHTVFKDGDSITVENTYP